MTPFLKGIAFSTAVAMASGCASTGYKKAQTTSTSLQDTAQRYIIAAMLAVCISLVGTGCQTAKGFGEDIEDLGENIQGK